MNIANQIIYIGDPTRCTKCRINYRSLNPFARMRVVLEQAIFADYLIALTESDTYIKYFTFLQGEYMSLNQELFHANETLNSLYRDGMSVLKDLFAVDRRVFPMVEINTRLATLQAIFSEQSYQYEKYPYYTGSMTKTFLDQYCMVLKGIFPQGGMEDNVLRPAAIFIPDEKILETRIEDTDKQIVQMKYLATELMTVAISGLEIDKLKTSRPSWYNFLSAARMENYNVDDLIGIMASFSLDHAKTSAEYVMANYTASPRVADICFDLVTGSTFTGIKAGKRPVDMDMFVRTINEMIDEGRLQQVSDHVLFGELLNKTGETSATVNYFMKPDAQVTAEEARSFRQSEFVKLVQDRLRPGLAAIDAETGEETDDAGDEPATTDDPTTDNPDEEVTGDMDEPVGGGTPEAPMETGTDTPDAEQEKKNPTLDPNMMLLELAKPSENMADYIFREMVGKRIATILKNPPENARPNDLLMLKRWKSRWLYLASIACLRDFLARVSLRLTDTK